MPIDNKEPLGSAEMAEAAQTRALFYSLLILPFASVPDSAFMEKVLDAEFLTLLEGMADDREGSEDISAGAALMLMYLRALPAQDMSECAQALSVERTRLYRGVAPGYGPPPPYGAVWGTGTGATELLQALMEFYHRFGLGLAAEAKERPDYIAVELEFQRQLALREIDARQNCQAEDASAFLEAQFAFLCEHLEWIPRFIEEALPMAQTGFYRGHLLLLRGFLACELEYLRP